MIKAKIKNNYENQYKSIQNFNNDIFVVDYTNQTGSKRNVELFSSNAPNDISYFSIKNSKNLDICGIPFDKCSFVDKNNKSKKQCEAVFFPKNSEKESWILFCELKYNYSQEKNKKRINEACKQLFKTSSYYYKSNIISKNNIKYLIVSLPKQKEPFLNFNKDIKRILKLKKNHNIILRYTNSVEVKNKNLCT